MAGRLRLKADVADKSGKSRFRLTTRNFDLDAVIAGMICYLIAVAPGQLGAARLEVAAGTRPCRY